tara:strand:+ start:78 stop:473 length:396 start_codon:yes stop_codon:yes gene_type:complete
MTNFLAATLFGSMISFMILISPIVFTVLSANDAKNFLRKFFPRLFIFGMILSSLLLVFTLRELDFFNQKLSIIIFLGFFINLFFITPKVNKYRDLEMSNVKNAKKIFSILHSVSVCIFIIQLILSLVIIFN